MCVCACMRARARHTRTHTRARAQTHTHTHTHTHNTVVSADPAAASNDSMAAAVTRAVADRLTSVGCAKPPTVCGLCGLCVCVFTAKGALDGV